MTNKIVATFFRKRFQDSGRDQSPDYYVYDFTNTIDSDKRVLGDCWFKETKLLRAVSFEKGEQYRITLSETSFPLSSGRLPFPTEVSWDNGRVYLKGGSRIVRVDKDGKETRVVGAPDFRSMIRRFEKGT